MSRTLWSALMLAWLCGTNAGGFRDEPALSSYSTPDHEEDAAMPADAGSPDELTMTVAKQPS